uniref:Alternative protein C2orf54 n=1 Tax=Homo sapiens TaxID=9606 RepID=L8E9P9_HUMAN|nr:alternative protein C2orf54 [Homo sapiens]
MALNYATWVCPGKGLAWSGGPPRIPSLPPRRVTPSAVDTLCPARSCVSSRTCW